MRRIQGAGGGGGGGSSRAPVEAPDSLRSKATARILDLVSEGEIEGWSDPDHPGRCVYLDGTPLENDDGTVNFSGVSYELRTGTQDQEYIPGFSAVENEISARMQVKTATPFVKRLSSLDLDAVRVRISIPALSSTNPSNGDISGASVQIAIDVQSNGGGYVPAALSRAAVALADVLGVRSTECDIDAASLQILWTGVASAGAQSVVYAVESRPRGSSDAWTELHRGAFSGVASVYSDDVGTVWNIPSGSYTLSLSLERGAYEFRLVRVSGVGSLGWGTTTASAWVGYDTISGKTSSKYERAYRIALPGEGPWDIRVRRITPDSTTQYLQNQTWVESYTEIIDAKLRYPNSAIVAVTADSANFSSIPSRAYDLKLLRLRVPSNYDPTTRTYDGPWDGSFQVAWSDNPAWVWYDLATNARYGLGAHLDASQVDKWSLYQIGRYCDELVDDGEGGQEPRFTCNVYFQSRAEAFKVMNDLASVFQGMAYWASGAVTCIQGAPADPVYTYVPADVIEGRFSYSSTSIRDRHTVALVTWNDPEDMYRQAVEPVELPEAVARYGLREVEITAAGCASRGQAHRLGKYVLYSEWLQSETVSFAVGLDGALSRPGQIIQTSDPGRVGARLGGRILAVAEDRSSITLDAPVTIAPAQAYTVSVLAPATETAPDGSERPVLRPVDVPVINEPGETTVLYGAFPAGLARHAVWLLQGPVVPELWRVVSVSEKDGGTQYEITAVEHDPGKPDLIEKDIKLPPRQTSLFPKGPLAAPTDVSATEFLYRSGSMIASGVTVSWSAAPDPRVTGYEVQIKRPGQDWETIVSYVALTSADIHDTEPGVYSFRVRSRTAIGWVGPAWATLADQELYGKRLPPPDVAYVVRQGDSILWTYDNPPLDLAGFIVRFHDGNNAHWPSALPAHGGLLTECSFNFTRLDSGSKTLLVKAVDSSGVESVTAAAVALVIASGVEGNVILEDYHGGLDDATPRPWPGTVSGATPDPVTGALLADDTVAFWGEADAKFWPPAGAPFWRTMWADLSYGFDFIPPASMLDAALVVTVDAPAGVNPITEYHPGSQAAFWGDALDIFWPAADAPFWSPEPDWQPWPGRLTGLSYQRYAIRVRVPGGGQARGELSQVLVTLDVPDLVEDLDDVAISAGGTRMPITRNYRIIKTVQLTLQADGGAAVAPIVMDKDISGPLVGANDASGGLTAATVDATITGY